MVRLSYSQGCLNTEEIVACSFCFLKNIFVYKFVFVCSLRSMCVVFVISDANERTAIPWSVRGFKGYHLVQSILLLINLLCAAYLVYGHVIIIRLYLTIIP